MQLRRLLIENFKAIENTGWIEVDPATTVVVGRNESGKTSMLEAISYLGNNKEIPDSYLNAQNINDLLASDDLIPIVTAEVSIEPSDNIQSQLRNSRIDSTYITKFADGTREIYYDHADHDPPSEIFESAKERNRLRRELPIDILNSDLQDKNEEVWQDIGQFVNQQLNDQRYTEGLLNDILIGISESSDRRLERIETTVEDISERAYDAEISSGEVLGDLPPIIYEETTKTISDQITRAEITSQSEKKPVLSHVFKDVQIDWDSDSLEIETVRRKLDAFCSDLQEKINDAWTQKSVNLQFDPVFEGSELSKIDITVQDVESHDGTRISRHRDSPSERSDGFCRFLTLYIDLLTQIETGENALILADDPGVYFHPNQKERMLETLVEDFSKENQVIYTTHSPFLIDLSNTASIRAIEGETGRVQNNIHEVENEVARPVSEALGLTMGTEMFNINGCLLVEGPTEYYLFPALSSYFRRTGSERVALDGYRVIQMSGADESIKYAKWVEQGDVEFQIVLDNDSKGSEIKSEWEEQHPEFAERIHLLDEQPEDEDRDVEFEDLIPPDIYLNTVDACFEEHSEYSPITRQQRAGRWCINGEEYTGEGLADIAKEAVESQREWDFQKPKIAKLMAKRLNQDDIPSGEFDRLKSLFGTIKYGH